MRFSTVAGSKGSFDLARDVRGFVANPSDIAKTTAAPVEGKNSFTENEVTKRLADNGYGNISGVMLDKATDIWHATATKGGTAQMMVQVDYQGNITTKTAK